MREAGRGWRDANGAVGIRAPFRVRVVAAYFTLFGCAGGLLLAVLALRPVIERLHWDVRYSGTLSASEVAALVLVTIGCFLTARLLRQRRRAGALFAIVALGANIAMYTRTVVDDWPVVLSSLVGIALLLSAWRDLRADE